MDNDSSRPDVLPFGREEFLFSPHRRPTQKKHCSLYPFLYLAETEQKPAHGQEKMNPDILTAGPGRFPLQEPARSNGQLPYPTKKSCGRSSKMIRPQGNIYLLFYRK